MQIQLNGQPHTLSEPISLAQLLDTLGLADKRVAVELNQDIIPRSRHAQTPLQDGDVVEVVHAIGGG